MNLEEQARLYSKICMEVFYINPDQVFEYAEKGLKVAEKAKDKKSISLIEESKARVYTYRGQYDLASESLDKALKLAKEIKDEEREACVYITLGVMSRNQSKYELALDYYTKSLEIYERLGDKINIMTIFSNMGSIHRSLFNTERALHYINQALKIAEEENNPLGIMAANSELTGIYFQLKDFEKANESNLKILETSRETGNKHYEVTALQGLSFVAAEEEDFEKALEYADECINIAREINNTVLIAGALSGIAEINGMLGRHKECCEAAIEAYEMDPEDLHAIPTLLYCIIHSSILMDEKEQAADYLGRYHEIYQQTNQSGLHQALLDMEVKYETEKKEMQITSLEKEKSLYVWLGIAGLMVLLLIIGILIYRHRLNIQKRRTAEQQVKQLEQEKQLVATQAILDGETAERSRLAKDLHDGLGGMLSVIKLNLKDLKSPSVMEDEDVDRFGNALEMLDQSIGELRRVAHHIMPESLMRYGLKVSIEDFCRAIPGANFYYLGEDPKLDKQLEVLIYRCAYELINNAVKHAEATTINVQLVVDNGIVSLTVQDNGIGFNPDEMANGSGLNNIKTRVSAYNGKLNIQSAPGKGTEISIEIEPK